MSARVRSSVEPLDALATRPVDQITARRTWAILNAGERAAAAMTLLEREQHAGAWMAKEVAKSRGFRRATVQGWSAEKLAEAFATVKVKQEVRARELLHALHVPSRGPLMGSFLDALNVPHENGLAETNYLDDLTLTESQLAVIGEGLLSTHDPRDVKVYFLSLAVHHPELAPVLTGWVRSKVDMTPVPSSEDIEVDPGDLGEEGLAQDQVEEFTTLDKQLIFAVVDAAQGIEGALDGDEIDDLVDEVLQLNGRRHKSYFHAGFRDVLFDRELGGGSREENPSRARWYWAGAIQALARAGRWDAIVELLEAQSVAATLGDGADGASHAASRFVVRAMFETGRPAEVPVFVSRQALVRWPELFLLLLKGGTLVLRSGRASEAKRVFELLTEVVDEVADGDDSLSAGIFGEARRRHAHCLRELGEFQRAKALLEALLEVEPNPNMRAMVLADLGLIDGRFRRLSDVRLPGPGDDCAVLAEALAQGEHRYREAAQLDVPYSAHARLCLGIIDLLEDEETNAVGHLAAARAAFLARPERYKGGSLIECTELALGIALCLDYRAADMTAASEMICRSLAAGVTIPDAFLKRVLDALAFAPREAAAEVGTALLEQHGESVLDVLASSEVGGGIPGLTDALLTRSRDEKRGAGARAADLRRLIEPLKTEKRYEELEDVLDRLEALAVRGTGREEFVLMCEDLDRFEPAWARNDVRIARAHILESLGDYAKAAALLTDVFHMGLSSHDQGHAADAAGVLDRIESYGLGPDFTEPLRARLAGVMALAAPDEPSDIDRKPCRVLFVGGDERQSKIDDDLIRALAERAPHVSVDFLRTGWSSNWNKQVDEFKRRVRGKDAVVIMRFIRTGLGRKVRRHCEVPWRGCWGAGREQALRAILAAAEAAR